jgi:hypothetical protein
MKREHSLENPSRFLKKGTDTTGSTRMQITLLGQSHLDSWQKVINPRQKIDRIHANPWRFHYLQINYAFVGPINTSNGARSIKRLVEEVVPATLPASNTKPRRPRRYLRGRNRQDCVAGDVWRGVSLCHGFRQSGRRDRFSPKSYAHLFRSLGIAPGGERGTLSTLSAGYFSSR